MNHIYSKKCSTENCSASNSIISVLMIYIMILFSFKELSLHAMAPPVDDYNSEHLFNCRPKTQGKITQAKLNEWYKKLFTEAEDRGVIHSCSPIAVNNNVSYIFIPLLSVFLSV